VRTAQRNAIRNYRARLNQRGLARFEVLGLNSDRELVRSLARRLAEGGAEAVRLRSAVVRIVSGEAPRTGGVVAALRRSPLVGADLSFRRSRIEGRDVDL
jgi:hypothetical protein